MGTKKFIVKPVYFRTVHNGPSETRVFLVYDTENPEHERTECGNQYLVPNFILSAESWVTLSKWFELRGVAANEWRMTPPVFDHIDHMDRFVGHGEITKIG